MINKNLDKFLEITTDIEKNKDEISWTVTNETEKNYKAPPGVYKIHTLCIPKTSGEFLRFLVTCLDAKKILELGTSIGYSTLWLGLGAKETNGHVYTTEMFGPKIDMANENFKKAGLEKYITLLEGKIIDTLNTWKYGNVDFVFMDADKPRYKKYFTQITKILNDKAIIIIDNAENFAHNMRKFLETCVRMKYQVFFLDIDNGLLIINKNSNINLITHFENELPKTTRKAIFKT